MRRYSKNTVFPRTTERLMPSIDSPAAWLQCSSTSPMGVFACQSPVIHARSSMDVPQPREGAPGDGGGVWAQEDRAAPQSARDRSMRRSMPAILTRGALRCTSGPLQVLADAVGELLSGSGLGG